MRFFQSSLFSLLLFVTLAVHAKPQSPVSVTIEANDIVMVGEPVDFTVTAVSSVDTNSLRLSVIPPAGIQLLSGDMFWQGVVRAYQPVTMNFSAILPDTGTYIGAEVVIRGLGYNRFVNRAVLQYREVRALKRQQLPSGNRYSHGRRVVEYPVNTARP